MTLPAQAERDRAKARKRALKAARAAMDHKRTPVQVPGREYLVRDLLGEFRA